MQGARRHACLHFFNSLLSIAQRAGPLWRCALNSKSRRLVMSDRIKCA